MGSGRDGPSLGPDAKSCRTLRLFCSDVTDASIVGQDKRKRCAEVHSSDCTQSHTPWFVQKSLAFSRHRQLDWLWSRQGRRGRPHERLCPGGHAADRGPGLEGLGPGGSILDGGEVIAAEVEEVVDLVVSGEKPLGLTG